MTAGSSDVDLFFFTASRWLGKYYTFMEPLQPYLDNPEVNIWGSDTTGRIQAAVDGFPWHGWNAVWSSDGYVRALPLLSL